MGSPTVRALDSIFALVPAYAPVDFEIEIEIANHRTNPR
jgi:hypothetical protein